MSGRAYLFLAGLVLIAAVSLRAARGGAGSGYARVGVGGAAPALTGMDGANVFETATWSQQNGAGPGVPDNAFFAANGSHPDVQLWWSNVSALPNAHIMTPGQSIVLKTTHRPFKAVQVFGLSTSGNSSITLLLTYVNATTASTSSTLPDWYNMSGMNLGANQFLLIDGVDRYDILQKVSWAKQGGKLGFRLIGVPAPADPLKSLATITITNSGANPVGSKFVLKLPIKSMLSADLSATSADLTALPPEPN